MKMKAKATLKEEIKEELTYFPINKTGDYELVSEKILKLIEKRIDSRIKFINDNNTSDLGKYSVMELELLKKEMLK
jgi:hypothetical protein